jgi:hypothetical protein
MIQNSIVYQSTYLSVIVQILTALLAIPGFLLQIGAEDQILKNILLLETIVQIIEFSFYVWFIVRFNLQNMAATRYFDWFITTPTMLFTTIIFMKYQELYEKKVDRKFTVIEFISKYKNDIILIFISNFLMLLFGYLGEIGVIPRLLAATIGFIFFLITFYTIYINYAVHSILGKKLFTFLFVVWGSYGLAYLLNVVYKNIALNGLDIVAKNFFGIYLVYEIYKKSKLG